MHSSPLRICGRAPFVWPLREAVTTGQPIAECGNSGNSAEPHVHMQVMDSRDLALAQGIPLAFQRFREWHRGSRHPTTRESGIPGEGAIVEPLTTQ